MDLKELATKIHDHLSSELEIVQIVIFGSYVTKLNHEDSDLDLLVITKEKCNWVTRNLLLDRLTDIMVERDLVIDAHIISQEELATIRGKQPFIQNALKYGIAV